MMVFLLTLMKEKRWTGTVTRIHLWDSRKRGNSDRGKIPFLRVFRRCHICVGVGVDAPLTETGRTQGSPETLMIMPLLYFLLPRGVSMSFFRALFFNVYRASFVLLLETQPGSLSSHFEGGKWRRFQLPIVLIWGKVPSKVQPLIHREHWTREYFDEIFSKFLLIYTDDWSNLWPVKTCHYIFL